MKVKELIKILEGLNQEMPINVPVAYDENGNIILYDIIIEEENTRGYVVFGKSDGIDENVKQRVFVFLKEMKKKWENESKRTD